jgi:branched-chain amino acid transport system substrate-binding protein
MKKAFIPVIVLISAVLLTSPVLSQTSKTPAGNPIKIGGSLPLTGIYSETARWVKQGYDFWVDDINKRGGLLGRPVKMILYDDESSPDKAVLYYERAITVDKVDLVSGGYPGAANVALMPLVEKYGKVFVGMGGHMKSFEQGYTYTFASPPLMSEWTYIALSKIFDDLITREEWPKSIAVLTANNVMGLSARGNILKAMEERGFRIVVDEVYNLPLSDATPLVGKAKGKGAEALCCLSFFDDAVMIMRAAKAMNFNPKLIFQQTVATLPAWMKELGEDGNYVANSAFWSPELPYPGNKQIYEGSKARFGIPVPPTHFGFSYGWMKTLEVAVEGAGTLEDKKIRDYLRSHKFDLPYAKGITFDSRGLPPPYNMAVQTMGGRYKIVWPKEVATAKFVYPRPDWSR